MVQVFGCTYRVVRVGVGNYEVVRLLDDQVVGRFRTIPHTVVESTVLEPAVMADVVRAAIQGAKTSWVGRLSIA
jgi:hypothetical protein